MDILFANGYLAVLMLILGFGFLIFVHELGHFLVAKWVGIRATQFAVGFGQAIVSYRKGIGLKLGSTEPEYRRRASDKLTELGKSPKQVDEKTFYEAADGLGLGETEYRLNWLPLGGYVKMLGQEDMDPNAQSDDPRAFNRKPIWARASVISAGVIVNLIVGLLFLIVAFSDFAGVKFAAPVVGFAQPGMPAALTYAEGHENDPAFRGLRTDDRILEVNGKPIEDLTAVLIASALGAEGVPVELLIERDSIEQPLTYRITPVRDPNQEDMFTLGIATAFTLDIAETLNVEAWADTPWGLAGVQPGTQVVSLDGQPVATPGQLQDALRESRGQAVTVGFASTGESSTTLSESTVVHTPNLELPRSDNGDAHLLGLKPATVIQTVQPGSPAQAAGLQAGDVLARVGSQPYPTLQGVIDQVAAANGGPVALEVWRGDERITLPATEPRGGRLGIGLGFGTSTNVLHGVGGEGVLAALNLPAGSRLQTLNGQPIADFAELARRLQTLAAENSADATPTVELGFRVNVGPGTQETFTFTLDADAREQLHDVRWTLPTLYAFFTPNEVRVAGETIGQAAALGLQKTGEFVQQTYITLLRLIQGGVQLKNLRGPVGIVEAGVTVSQRGWPYYLFFLGLISVNLAVINFLPLPIVDGGLMVFLIIEKVRGKPAGVAVQNLAMILGLALIAGVFLIVTYHDIARIVSGI